MELSPLLPSSLLGWPKHHPSRVANVDAVPRNLAEFEIQMIPIRTRGCNGDVRMRFGMPISEGAQYALPVCSRDENRTLILRRTYSMGQKQKMVYIMDQPTFILIAHFRQVL